MKRTIKLTPKDKDVLFQLKENGGYREGYIPLGILTKLTQLGLIEKRQRYSPAEQADMHDQMAKQWNLLETAVRNRNMEAVEKIMDKITSIQGDIDWKVPHLTDTAYELLSVGEITIKL